MRNPPRDLVLETLLEERDHLRIQINLFEHSPGSDAAELERIRLQLKEIEIRISRQQSGG